MASSGQFDAVLKGHGFSRATNVPRIKGLKAPEGFVSFKLTRYPVPSLPETQSGPAEWNEWARCRNETFQPITSPVARVDAP